MSEAESKVKTVKTTVAINTTTMERLKLIADTRGESLSSTITEALDEQAANIVVSVEFREEFAARKAQRDATAARLGL